MVGTVHVELVQVVKPDRDGSVGIASTSEPGTAQKVGTAVDSWREAGVEGLAATIEAMAMVMKSLAESCIFERGLLLS